MESVKIVFDIGGTKTRIAAVEEDTALRDITIFETDHDPEVGVQNIISTIHKIVGDFPIAAICGGSKGAIDNGVIKRVNHITRWAGTPLREILEHEFETKVYLMNDVELIGIGEYYYGAGKGIHDMMYLTVSTGVGGSHIVDGRIDKGKYNAEPGHQMVDSAELESLISGPAVEKKYGKPPKEIDDITIRNELAEILARGLYDNVLHWSPEVIVLGGSMIVGKNPIPIEHTQKTLDALVLKYHPEAPKIKKAELGDHGGLYGGMAYLNYSV